MKKIITLWLSLALVLNINSQSSGDWTQHGPMDFPMHLNWQIGGVARISQMQFHPTDSNTLYAVNSMGGLFISHNKGTNWVSYGTDKLPQTRCASVCIDYTDDRIVYFGTGDPSYYSNGLGIWKTIDDGNTWARQSSIGDRMAVEILMSPTDHNVLLAATNDGIWKTTNGGTTWTAKKSGGQFTNMVFKPGSNGVTVYAATMNEFWKSTDNGR